MTKMGIIFTLHMLMILTFCHPVKNSLTPTFTLPKAYWVVVPVEPSQEVGSIILKVAGIHPENLVTLDGGGGDFKINGPVKDNFHLVLQQKLKPGRDYKLIITASGPRGKGSLKLRLFLMNDNVQKEVEEKEPEIKSIGDENSDSSESEAGRAMKEKQDKEERKKMEEEDKRKKSDEEKIEKDVDFDKEDSEKEYEPAEENHFTSIIVGLCVPFGLLLLVGFLVVTWKKLKSNSNEDDKSETGETGLPLYPVLGGFRCSPQVGNEAEFEGSGASVSETTKAEMAEM
ncbi:uncharacterized protein LOC136027429 [Artemia franciscana]|uniref:Uncharacterized protein n=1 Tax=Artemia franciscana TaxID=6661 RepID=A0AA88KWR8_ARTSF|nr:hypothetical protein QYM36_013785 [Artemia franciscana]